MMATMAFCDEKPGWFQGKENDLLRALMAAKDLQWNQKEENGVKQIIEDIQAGRDPTEESEVIRMELAYAFKDLMSLNPYREEQIKSWFRQFLGGDLASDVFQESEKIMNEELRKKSYVQHHLDFSRRQKGAWNHVVSDAKRDRDMTDHNKSILKRISTDASKVFALPPEDLEAEKAMLVMSYGQDTANRIMNGIQAVHDEVRGKAHAQSEAEKAMKELLAGHPAQVQPVAAKPGQVQAADANPAQVQAATRTREDAAATKPAQAQAAAARPVQVQAADAKRTQEDAAGTQGKSAAANPAKVENAAAKRVHVQAADDDDDDDGANPTEVQVAGAKRTPEDGAGAKRTQGQAATPTEVQAARSQQNAAKPARGKAAQGKPTPGQAA
ncbi:PREDICTED: uncharacterized protein LOC109482386 [Branchiostoma belcheri]|uniref:Uncharacterized protein LOC109482386 n=1 Tax=Branchiostoma belcheri TaxID=7741 RepID=A0A6P4ZHI7_BRABE|nr:PREDICTED: uncharacterized protein LOC109482386 [Branchiostoma belcheri]